VGLQLTAYGGRNDNLFAAAVGDAIFYPTVNDETYQDVQFQQFSTTVGCDTSADQLACLRNLDINELQKANVGMAYPGQQIDANFIWTPVVDGSFIQDRPLSLYRDGKSVNVPLIVGDVVRIHT
jgi:carboxylesterase type B